MSVGLDCRAMGGGEIVVLVHGALGDRRLWDRHLPLLAHRGYRAIAVTLPHHGPQGLASETRPFGLRSHTDALAAFVAGLGAQSVHLVAWSYAAHAALTLAVEHPRLLRSVFVYEPGFPTFVTDPEALQAFADDVTRMFEPVSAAMAGGDLQAAVRHLIDGSADCTGYFASQAASTQAIELDNAHTLPLLMRQTPPPSLSAAQIAAIDVPTCVAVGARTRPAYAVVGRVAQALLAEHALTVPGASHMWPLEDPAAFCEAVVALTSRS